jgi:hypothetical protein
MEASAGAPRQRRKSSVLLSPIGLDQLVAPDLTHEQRPQVAGDHEEGAGTLGRFSEAEKSLLDRQSRSVFGPGIVVKSANAFKDAGPAEEEVVRTV